MSIFANEDGMVGTIMVPVKTEGTDGFDAFGKPVPQYRREAANSHLKAMGINDAETRWNCVQQMADAIGRDKPHAALEAAYRVVDVTGAYVLLAVLCASRQEPTP